MPKYIEEPLDKAHNRKNFDCGNEELNTFLRCYAGQSHKKGTAKTYLTLDKETKKIIGFYSITLTSIEYNQIPKSFQKGLSRHQVPLFILARLGVDVSEQNKGIGGVLLYKAIERCIKVSEEVGGIGLLIEAKDDDVAKWYSKFGAISLPDKPLSLILPFSTIKNIK
ncbi:N-acetyltransferase [Pasteurella atlantica]|uniref:N-acetyltransferase n=1 Tax=Pasteurella atlantica TaxID=2827233 RepID=A0AAW8CRI5_9PAST|nr:N-acetyltransferase [Pasteurella atlantica]MBR0574458.1 N-acetyltransferase [Pasteurella atlantica]MDP8032925.1 N-acetyltransferase [Pasteurella atlantica]MDP8034918.1 N-acetyltransferase [Pasteurella atlantica]MDP8036812.1 N-acetyltransferase [Pasteurella atlantica]MDP8039335.1 N-acetyltransferase [Pasteurella atlantica]